MKYIIYPATCLSVFIDSVTCLYVCNYYAIFSSDVQWVRILYISYYAEFMELNLSQLFVYFF